MDVDIFHFENMTSVIWHICNKWWPKCLSLSNYFNYYNFAITILQQTKKQLYKPWSKQNEFDIHNFRYQFLLVITAKINISNCFQFIQKVNCPPQVLVLAKWLTMATNNIYSSTTNTATNVLKDFKFTATHSKIGRFEIHVCKNISK